jgi:hypothetical protein
MLTVKTCSTGRKGNTLTWLDQPPSVTFKALSVDFKERNVSGEVAGRQRIGYDNAVEDFRWPVLACGAGGGFRGG